MGCITSKEAEEKGESTSPSFEYAAVVIQKCPASFDHQNQPGLLDFDSKADEKSDDRGRETKKARKANSVKKGSISFKLGFSHRYVEAEQVAAGWPSWLSNAAGEAVHGWVPLKADSFEKLDKIGQGTYSSVFRACEVETGRIVALKKVRFDNFQAESIRFMAREIMILRRLDHPNIMKLEGIITSKMSNSIYLVFEYMEHDLAGLVSCPNITFSEAQVKCYMRQLLSAVEHCHLRGIMHRDIKTSNILVNNEGILKLGDFGLANVLNTRSKQPLTSRVVTLWYRPPELLMGSTNYGLPVDLWSVGCVFAELYLGKPILKGRTEVEQLHKIFKLCGSPPEEYWKRSLLPPTAAMFRPQHSYESSLWEKCKEFPSNAVELLEAFLSVDPNKRGTASSALMSEYFRTKPYACDPSALPKYPPNKEMDAKSREDATRRKHGSRTRDPGLSRKPRRVRKLQQEARVPIKFASKEEVQDNAQLERRNENDRAIPHKGRVGGLHRELMKAPYDTRSETSQINGASTQGDSAFTAPVQVSASSGFVWAKRRNEDATSAVSDGLKSQVSSLDPSFAKPTFELRKYDGHDLHEVQSRRMKCDLPSSFDASDAYYSIDMSAELSQRPDSDDLNNQDYEHPGKFSGPLSSQPRRIDEVLHTNESHVRRTTRKSRFERENN